MTKKFRGLLAEGVSLSKKEMAAISNECADILQQEINREIVANLMASLYGNIPMSDWTPNATDDDGHCAIVVTSHGDTTRYGMHGKGAKFRRVQEWVAKTPLGYYDMEWPWVTFTPLYAKDEIYFKMAFSQYFIADQRDPPSC